MEALVFEKVLVLEVEESDSEFESEGEGDDSDWEWPEGVEWSASETDEEEEEEEEEKVPPRKKVKPLPAALGKAPSPTPVAGLPGPTWKKTPTTSKPVQKDDEAPPLAPSSATSSRKSAPREEVPLPPPAPKKKEVKEPPKKQDRSDWVKPPSRAGRPKHSKTYEDGLTCNQRERMRGRKDNHPDYANDYEWYMAEFKAGRVTCNNDFKPIKSTFTKEFTTMRGVKYDEGLGRHEGRMDRLFKGYDMLVQAGVPAEETPLRKYVKNKIDWLTDPSRTFCHHCDRQLKSYTGLKYHIKALHMFCASLLSPLTEEEIGRIERETREGAMLGRWRWDRKGRITTSRASAIFRRKTANPYKIAFRFGRISGQSFESPAMKRGKRLEWTAVQRFMLSFPNVGKVQYPVGLCIHPKFGFIGATPDGFIDKDGYLGCLEVKCPIHPIHQIPHRKNDRFLEENGNGTLRLKRNHKYFDQVVMQIICTDRQYCDFVVYYQNDDDPDNDWDIWTERIHRDEAEEAWAEMEPKLTAFYHKYLGPPSLA